MPFVLRAACHRPFAALLPQCPVGSITNRPAASRCQTNANSTEGAKTLSDCLVRPPLLSMKR